MKWKTIETAPKDGTNILGYDKPMIRMIKWWNNGESWVVSDTSGLPFYPTHWMILPKPPKDEK